MTKNLLIKKALVIDSKSIHNGQTVDFGVFNYSFTIEFTQMLSHQNRPVTIVNYSVDR